MKAIVAVAFLLNGNEIITMPKPARHYHLVRWLGENKKEWPEIRKSGSYEQGFLDEDGLFLNRSEAARRAYSIGQIISEVDELFSEDLW